MLAHATVRVWKEWDELLAEGRRRRLHLAAVVDDEMVVVGGQEWGRGKERGGLYTSASLIRFG